jgi:hypothetical protein
MDRPVTIETIPNIIGDLILKEDYEGLQEVLELLLQELAKDE